MKASITITVLTSLTILLSACMPSVPEISGVSYQGMQSYSLDDPLPVKKEFAKTLWWRALPDEDLENWVEDLITNNLDLRQAELRVQAAQANYNSAASGLWPDIGISSNVSKTNITDAVISDSSQAQLGGEISWQLDLFGKIRARKQRSDTIYQATQSEYQAVINTLIAQLVRSRIDMIIGHSQLQLAQQVVASYKQQLDLLERRYVLAGGSVSSADIHVLRARLTAANADIAPLQLAIDKSWRSVEILLAKPPNQIPHIQLTELSLPPQLQEAPPPVALLDHRPDLRSARLRVKAAQAGVGVALADLYPQAVLSFSIFDIAGSLANLLDGKMLVSTLAGNISQLLFTGGRLQANLDLSKIEFEQAQLEYREAVLQAWHEANAGLQSMIYYRREHGALLENVRASHQAMQIIRDRYETGLATVFEQIETQRSYWQARRRLLDNLRNNWQAYIQTSLAFGGNWQDWLQDTRNKGAL